MEFSFEPSRAKTPRSLKRPVGSSLSTNDRLQKAIERNRAKQAKRQMASSVRANSPTSSSARGINASLEERKKALQAKFKRAVQLEAEQEVVVVPSRATTSPTRKTVAVSGKVNFSSNPKKSKLSNSVKYLGSTKRASTKRGVKTAKNNTILEHLSIMGWIAIAILTVRLLFSDRGVFDYYAHKDKLNQIYHERALLQQNNQDLLHEIKLIETNPKYQKKIVRDNLGFIAKSEYLILFAKGRVPASTK